MSKNNGHEEESIAEKVLTDEMKERFAGARLYLKDIQAEDGRLAQATRQNNKNVGVINHALSPSDDDNYRDIELRIGAKCRIYIEAIHECETYGLIQQKKYIIDRMHEEAARNPSPLLRASFQALTHTSITATANNFTGKVKSWWNRNSNNTDGGLKNDSYDQ